MISRRQNGDSEIPASSIAKYGAIIAIAGTAIGTIFATGLYVKSLDDRVAVLEHNESALLAEHKIVMQQLAVIAPQFDPLRKQFEKMSDQLIIVAERQGNVIATIKILQAGIIENQKMLAEHMQKDRRNN